MDPGPLDRIDPATLAPFPDARSFEGIVIDHLEQLAGSDTVLAGAAAHTVENPPDDLPGVFQVTIGDAAANAANEDQTTPPSPVPDLLSAGDNIDARRVDASRYLPDENAPIEQDFQDPPPAPSDIGEPGGVENPPPPQI